MIKMPRDKNDTLIHTLLAQILVTLKNKIIIFQTQSISFAIKSRLSDIYTVYHSLTKNKVKKGKQDRYDSVLYLCN